MNEPRSRIAGCIFGAALGDALGAQTEFVRSQAEILERWPPFGPTEPSTNASNLFEVTDDTQMMLCVGRAATAEPGQVPEPRTFRKALIGEFVAWLNDPRNNRAPGNTCLDACERLAKLTDVNAWTRATVFGSKGCGANMRVQAIGLLACSDETRAGLAQLQAAVTHAHPTALVASDVTAFALHAIATRTTRPDDLVETLLDYTNTQSGRYHARWLGNLWECTHEPSPEHFMERGSSEVASSLARLRDRLESPDRPDEDPADASGEGWIAEEALATSLYCFLRHQDDPHAAIQRAARSRGDSDTLACLAGSFAGAHCGAEAWRPDWVQRLEYSQELNQVVDALLEQGLH